MDSAWLASVSWPERGRNFFFFLRVGGQCTDKHSSIPTWGLPNPAASLHGLGTSIPPGGLVAHTSVPTPATARTRPRHLLRPAAVLATAPRLSDQEGNQSRETPALLLPGGALKAWPQGAQSPEGEGNGAQVVVSEGK